MTQMSEQTQTPLTAALQPTAARENTRHSVFLADTRQVVNTTLRRAEEIRYAADIELAGRSRDNYFALERLDASVPDITRGAIGQASKAVLGTGANMALTLYRAAKAAGESARLAWEKSGEVRAVTDAAAMGTMDFARAQRELTAIEARYSKLKTLGREALQVMRANHERFLQESGLGKDEQDGFVYDLVGGATTLAAAVAVTALTKSPSAAAALFGAYAGRQDYEEALDNNISPDRAMLVGLAGGVAEGALEHLGLGALEKVFKGKGILRAGLKGFTTEAVQEGSQQTAEEIIMQNFGGRERELQETFTDIAYSALLGGLTGAPVSVIMNFAQRQFKEKGADDETAKKLAQIAVEHAGSDAVQQTAHKVLSNLTSALNYPNADVSQGAKEFGAAVRGAQDRTARRAVYNVSQRTEQNARAAGYDAATAELLGQLEQSRANSIYRLAGVLPSAQMDLTQVRFERVEGAQEAQLAEQEQEYDVEAYGLPDDALFQSAAMYRNKAKSLAEFRTFAVQNQGNPKEDNKSFYRFTTKDGLDIEVPFERALHIDGEHHLTDEQFGIVEKYLADPIYAAILPHVGEYQGRQVKIKLNTPLGSMGVVLEVLPKGRVFLNTAFFDTNANIDNWAKGNPPNAPSDKPVFIGEGHKYSLADIIQKIKGQDKNTATLEQGGLFDSQLDLFAAQAQDEQARTLTPADEELAEAGEMLFSQEELQPNLPPFTPKEKPAPVRIEDFGEKILGARKDLWGKYKDALSRELPKNAKNVTLAQYFPEPNYDAAFAQGATAEQMAAVKALRDSVPAKPQNAWRQTRWLQALEVARQTANEILDGKLSPQVLRTRAGNGPIAQRLDFYIELGYPLFTKARAFSFRARNGCTFYNGQRFEEPTTIYEFDRGYNTLYGSPDRGAVMAFIRNYLQHSSTKTPAPTKLDIYQNRATGEIVIGKKITSGKYVDLKGGFSRVADAAKYLQEHQTHLEALLEEKKKMPQTRRDVNDPRIGVEYRPAGTVVTPERFMQEFGFRGVQFGNWVEQTRRAQDLNNAYDALLDMADLIHIPARAVSLDGTLGLAFGARGIPNASAHYEQGQTVINLTKNKGAGSLAHEWWHALDNYFGRKGGENFMATLKMPTQIRPEMREVFDEVRQTVRQVLAERSKNADSTRVKDYWSTDEEMTARAFEAYLIHKGKEKGRRNDYLANIVSESAFKFFGGDSAQYPYPTAAEMPVIAEAFDAFFAVLKTEQSQKGYTLFQDEAEEGDISFDFGANVPAPAAAPRGSVTFNGKNEAVIKAFAQADKSTALHEFFHVWEHDLLRFEQVSTNEEFLQLVRDLREVHASSYGFVSEFIKKTKMLTAGGRQIALDNLHARGGEEYVRRLAFDDTLDAADITAQFIRRAFRENFALLAEKYFMRGKAPSARYESLFAKFGRWLRELYDSVLGKVEISPAVQSIFDRMMTHDAARVDSNLFTGKVEQIKQLVKNIREGNPNADGAPSLSNLKNLLAQLDAPRPQRPQTHLLKDLRKYGAEYNNAGQIDQEAYKNARVYNKKGGVDDRPDVWLQKLGYMDFEDTTPETLQEAYDKIQRALDGQTIYTLGGEEQQAEWENYKANLDTLREVFGGNASEIRSTLNAILDLEAKGYRVVEKRDLAHMALRLSELSRLAERLEVKTKTAQEKETLDKKTLADARRVKRNIMLELEKRQVEGKGELLKKLAAAKTFEQIHLAAEEVLNFLSAAYEQTAEGAAERRRLDVPDTNWDAVRVELLQKYNAVLSGADKLLKYAWDTLDRLSAQTVTGGILSEDSARTKEAAERIVNDMGEKLDGQYVRAMEKVLQNIPHLSAQDVRNFLASYGKKATRYRALNQSMVEQFIRTAQKTQEANYKKYMRGKIGEVLSRKMFEKVGAARRAKYSPEAMTFLTNAAAAWHGTQESALAAYEQAVGEIDPNNPPTVWKALENRVLWIKADVGAEVSMADLRALYDDALSAVRGDRAFKRMEGIRQAVQEDNLRLAAELSLKDRKFAKGTAAYLLHGGTDLQTFLSICFGKYEVDEFDENSTAQQNNGKLKNALPPDAKPVAEINSKQYDYSGSQKNIKKQLVDWYRKNLQGKTIKNPYLGEVYFTSKGIYEFGGKSLSGQKAVLLHTIKQIVEKGLLIGSKEETGRKDGVVKFYFLQGKILLDGKEAVLQADIAEDRSGKKFYYLSQIENKNAEGLSRDQNAGAFGSNSITDKEQNFKPQTKKRLIDFREELAPETNQIEEANFNSQAQRDILRAVGTAYGLKTPMQIMDKIAELQKDTVELTNYAYVKDQENGEIVATLFKNGKPVTHNKPRKQTISRLETLTFWIWNQDHDFVQTAMGTEDYGLAGRLEYAYGKTQLENLFARLTPQDKAAAQNLQKLAEKHHGEESLVHQRIYGFPLPKKEFYFPSVTDRTTDQIDMKQEFVQNSKAPSFIKRRVQSKRVIQRVANPVDILSRHLRRAGEFIYNAEKYTQLVRVFKQSSMATAFEEAFGEKNGKKVYSKLLALINQQAPQGQQAKDEFYKIANKAFGGWVKAVMGFKPITGIKQFASSVSFAERMPWSDWAKWFAEGLANPMQTAEFMKRLSPYIQTRYESGGMNEAVARAMASDEISPISSRWNNLTNLMLLNTRLGDKASLIYGGYPYMKYLLEVKKLTPEQAARTFEKQATRTLQSSLRVHLSEGQANADSFAARVFLVFKNQQLQYVRKVAESYTAYKNGEMSGAAFAKTAFLYLILNPMVYTMLGLGYFAADEDDWGEDLKRLLTSPVSQFFGAYPFGEGVADFFMDNAISVWKDQKLTPPQKMGMPMFDDIYKDVARLVKTVNMQDVSVTDFLPVFFDAAKYTGLPTQTFRNMAGGTQDLLEGRALAGGLRLIGYTKNRTDKITGDDK